MRTYSNSSDIISDLHSRGFTHDFQLFGNDLLWVQKGIFVRAGEFAILEYHTVTESKNGGDKRVVFGVVASYHNAKGILLDDYKKYSATTPPVLVRKLNELKINDDDKFQ